MKKITIIFSILFLISISCSNSNERVSYYENGNIKEKRIFLSSKDTLSYHREIYYPEGKIHFKGQVVNNKTEGRLFEYSNDGIIRVSTLYINGKKNGLQYFYDENGELFEKDYFSDDTLMLTYKYFNKQGYLVNIIRKGEPVLIGRIMYTNNGNINKDSSYYYSCQTIDTMIINKEYECKLEIFNLGRGKQYVEFELLDPFNMVTFTKGDKIVSDSLKLNFSLKPQKAGNILIEGIINVTSDTTKEGKNFPFHKEFYVKSAK
jgi:hypothetical protein